MSSVVTVSNCVYLVSLSSRLVFAKFYDLMRYNQCLCFISSCVLFLHVLYVCFQKNTNLLSSVLTFYTCSPIGDPDQNDEDDDVITRKSWRVVRRRLDVHSDHGEVDDDVVLVDAIEEPFGMRMQNFRLIVAVADGFVMADVKVR